MPSTLIFWNFQVLLEEVVTGSRRYLEFSYLRYIWYTDKLLLFE